MKRVLHVVTRLPFALWYVAFFVWELVLANLHVAWEAATPDLSMHAGILRVPTHCRNRWEILLLANTITMTPGTLTLDVDTDKWEIYVHTLYFESREEFVESIHRLERALLRAMR